MFPLGTVLMPTMFLPLHVFEPRYRTLVQRCLDGDREFGVVLIERGSEVGGDDVRTFVGTVARIIEAQELPDGRWVLATVGAHRIRVQRWLADAPHPLADVEPWPDEPATASASEGTAAAAAVLRRVLALKAELGEPAAPATVELSTDPSIASYQISALAPVGPLDQHALLCAAGADDRLAHVRQLLDDEEGYLRTRLSLG